MAAKMHTLLRARYLHRRRSRLDFSQQWYLEYGLELLGLF